MERLHKQPKHRHTQSSTSLQGIGCARPEALLTGSPAQACLWNLQDLISRCWARISVQKHQLPVARIGKEFGSPAKHRKVATGEHVLVWTLQNCKPEHQSMLQGVALWMKVSRWSACLIRWNATHSHHHQAEGGVNAAGGTLYERKEVECLLDPLDCYTDPVECYTNPRSAGSRRLTEPSAQAVAAAHDRPVACIGCKYLVYAKY